MIVVMRQDAEQRDVDHVVDRIRKAGLDVHLSEGVEHTIVGVVGDVRHIRPEDLQVLPRVLRVVRIMHPFKLASREFREHSEVKLNGISIGGRDIAVMAGPCAVESREVLMETARGVRAAGASVLRGGAFKPRTSPYSFQGLGEEGLQYMAEAREATGLLVVTEVLSPADVELVSSYADILQIGARNMQNYSLLHEVGAIDKPVLLKRGMMSSVEEWLMSAEYVLSGGNHRVILCERGIRTFEGYTRNTLDLSSVPLVKGLSHLPVIVDPSHGTGRADLVAAMSRAAIAAGADGLLIEVHPRPEEALSDGPQSLTLEDFSGMMKTLEPVAEAVDRGIAVEATA
ncbi:MAG: 3-deoxy-7-phosphoheptulonate synthase [Clostridia bacterium]